MAPRTETAPVTLSQVTGAVASFPEAEGVGFTWHPDQMIDRSTPGVILYTGLDQPDVEVRDPDDPEVWHEGELRMWRRDADGAWWADVQWRRGPGQGNYVDTFAEEDVRLDERATR